MSFNQIDVENIIQNVKLNYSDFVKKELDESKNNLLAEMNKEGSIEYYFEGLLLKRKMKNEKSYVNSLLKLGFSEQNIRNNILQIKIHPIYFDFEAIANRYKNYIKQFAATTRYDLSNIKINITFDPFVNAGVKKLKDCYVILVYFGTNFIHQWLSERKIFDYFFVETNAQGRESKIHFPNENVYLIDNIIKGLRSRAKVIFGYQKDVNIKHLEFAISSNEIIHNKTEFHKDLYEKRTNILSVEKFILFHELGHIFYGHLEEYENWKTSPCSSKIELKNRLIRRRQMELEADKFGFDFLQIQTALEKHLPLENFHQHDNCYFNYYNPILDLFTLFHMAQNDKINFSDEFCPYPSNRDRLINLLGEQKTMFLFELFTNYFK